MSDQPTPPPGPLAHWVPPPHPARQSHRGRWVTLEPLTLDHAADLHAALAEDDGLWRYLPTGPFANAAEYAAWVANASIQADPLHFAVRMRDGSLGGTLSLLRITPAAGSIEVGWVTYAPRLQRTPEATEAIFLLMKWSFDAGYRRFEWKCNALNRVSRGAAERLGLSYEGIFRQAAVVKGQNRDTAWFAAVDGEWPELEAAFDTWLAPRNFEAGGRQRQSLRALTRPILATRDPTARDLSGGRSEDGTPGATSD